MSFRSGTSSCKNNPGTINVKFKEEGKVLQKSSFKSDKKLNTSRPRALPHAGTVNLPEIGKIGGDYDKTDIIQKFPGLNNLRLSKNVSVDPKKVRWEMKNLL